MIIKKLYLRGSGMITTRKKAGGGTILKPFLPKIKLANTRGLNKTITMTRSNMNRSSITLNSMTPSSMSLISILRISINLINMKMLNSFMVIKMAPKTITSDIQWMNKLHNDMVWKIKYHKNSTSLRYSSHTNPNQKHCNQSDPDNFLLHYQEVILP